ncbi:hypothetical protein VST7929_01101 [Vibrio stylophorae]|uniref:Queuine tRNA-ribosyltransferase n=1 Tax=Vibrio stylophorae TaxID=659351 RepID=A0ABN8DRG0_9VIBR|nr:hypothetical protein [Vibrio stylophorae]CAH0533237.1 hypothetical protein VST7929_01101 [Vibrio stylophorae]
MFPDVSTIGRVPTPVFYPSVSSVSKNVWSVIDHIELLTSLDFPQFLVSCFDVYKYQDNKRLLAALNKAHEQCQVVLWDSGIYEVAWSRSKRWCFKRYINTLRRNNVSHAFGFDDYCLANETANVKNIESMIKRTIGQIGSDVISPIVHCKDAYDYPEICKQVATICSPELIAIPERELGFGICEIAENISKIRSALNSTGKYQVLHILGTGNPLSMMLYAFAGADSFDGLDWCQTVVDFDSGKLHHPLQLDLYEHQSEYGSEKNLSFFARCYAHNLEFYRLWMEMLKQAIENDGQIAMLERYLPKSFLNKNQKLFSKTINRREEAHEALAN